MYIYISLSKYIYTLYLESATVCLRKISCLTVLTQWIEHDWKMAEKDNAILTLLTASFAMHLPGGWLHNTSFCMFPLLLNFLKYSLLCSSFGTKLSSCESSHHGALNLDRRQRWSSLERGGLRCGLSSWHYCKKCSVLALHHFSFLLVSWEHSSCCFFLPLTHSLVVIQNETTSFYLGTKEILLQTVFSVVLS